MPRKPRMAAERLTQISVSLPGDILDALIHYVHTTESPSYSEAVRNILAERLRPRPNTSHDGDDQPR